MQTKYIMYFRPGLDYQLTSSLLGIYNVLYYRSELDYQLTSSLVYPTLVDVSQISNITGSPSTAISCLYLNKQIQKQYYHIFYPTKIAAKKVGKNVTE